MKIFETKYIRLSSFVFLLKEVGYLEVGKVDNFM